LRHEIRGHIRTLLCSQKIRRPFSNDELKKAFVAAHFEWRGQRRSRPGLTLRVRASTAALHFSPSTLSQPFFPCYQFVSVSRE